MRMLCSPWYDAFSAQLENTLQQFIYLDVDINHVYRYFLLLPTSLTLRMTLRRTERSRRRRWGASLRAQGAGLRSLDTGARVLTVWDTGTLWTRTWTRAWTRVTRGQSRGDTGPETSWLWWVKLNSPDKLMRAGSITVVINPVHDVFPGELWAASRCDLGDWRGDQTQPADFLSPSGNWEGGSPDQGTGGAGNGTSCPDNYTGWPLKSWFVTELYRLSSQIMGYYKLSCNVKDTEISLNWIHE